MLEFLKSIGAISGLLSGLFLLYDRYAKGRPIASFTVRQQATRKVACIRVTNIGDHDVAIIDATVTPAVYFLTEDLEVGTLLEGAAGQRPYFMLKPREEKELVIAPRFRNGVALEVQSQNVTFRIYWRRCNATWLPQIPVYVLTNTATIRKYALEKGHA
jgi:hypothetical protein